MATLGRRSWPAPELGAGRTSGSGASAGRRHSPPYRHTYRRRDTVLGAENSEVLLAGSVAVAVTAPAARLRVRKEIAASPSEPVLDHRRYRSSTMR